MCGGGQDAGPQEQRAKRSRRAEDGHWRASLARPPPSLGRLCRSLALGFFLHLDVRHLDVCGAVLGAGSRLNLIPPLQNY